jgi:cobalamin biosynthesis protein CobC
MLKTTIMHGGALAAAAKKYGGNKADWLDLSTGINPNFPPVPKFTSKIWQALPDADLMAECLNAAKHFYNIPNSASLVAAPGVQALIQLLPQLKPGAKATILGPTYGEYAHVFQTLGGGGRIVNSSDELQQEAVGIIVNPNNPDGRAIAPENILAIAKSMASKDGLLIVDEAFCDLTPDVSVAKHAGMRGLLVLKSFGKFFGLAGVRLGFAAGHTHDMAILEQRLGPWAVSGPALAIGAKCYANEALKEKTSNKILSNSKAQRKVLLQAGLKLTADTGLFHLIENPKAHAIYEGLARQHILTRVFVDEPNWLRLGLCKNNAERARLKSALDVCLNTL